VLPVHGWRPFYPRRARLYRPLPLVAGLNGLPRLLLTLGAVVVPQIIGLVLVVSLPSRHQCASCGIMRTSLCRINFIGAMPGSHSSVQRDTGGDTVEQVLVRVRVRGVTLIPRAVRGTPQGAAVVSLDTFNHP